MAKTDVAVKENEKTALALAGAFDDIDTGFGDVDSNDFVIPRLQVLGDLSPQVKKQHAKYLEGAEPGKIADVTLGVLYEGGVPFLPVFREKVWLEWAPRKTGKGIVARYYTDVIAELGIEPNERGEYINDAGNEIIKTVQLYGLNLADEGRWSFVSFKKSGLKVMRQFMTKATSIRMPNGKTAPLMYKSYILNSFLDDNGENQWYNWKLEDGPLTMELPDAGLIIESAKGLMASVQSGLARDAAERGHGDEDIVDAEEEAF